MPKLVRKTVASIVILCAAGLVAAEARSEDQTGLQYQNLLTPLLRSGTDVLGAPIVFPQGDADITAAIVTIPPGGTTGWHHHEVPLFAYILEGELTVDYGDKGNRTYRTGDSVLEAVNWPHNGTNTGEVPMRLLALYMGGSGKANTVVGSAP
jgi:quercetin dioxygenase-like cupin family protein